MLFRSSNDHIDLTNISYSVASVSNASYSSSTNLTTLAITDGTSTDAIKLVGNYTINTAWHFSSDGHGGTLLTDSGSADLAQTVTAALTTQDGTADQFSFQSDGQSSTLAGASTLTASSQNASATDTATLDPSSSASSDHQPTAPATAAADTGPASNVAASSQQPTGDTTNTSTQAGATTQTAVAPQRSGPMATRSYSRPISATKPLRISIPTRT